MLLGVGVCGARYLGGKIEEGGKQGGGEVGGVSQAEVGLFWGPDVKVDEENFQSSKLLPDLHTPPLIKILRSQSQPSHTICRA